MIETPDTYSYSGTSSRMEKIFAKKDDAEMYIENRKKDFGKYDDVSFDIEEETVVV
jgi:hypothetical protein